MRPFPRPFVLLPLAALVLAACNATAPNVGRGVDASPTGGGEFYRSESRGIIPRGFPGPEDDE